MSYQNSYTYLNDSVPNKTLKNTLTLLALTTGFSALMAFVNMHLGINVGPIISIAVYFGLIFLLNMVKDSGGAIFVAFGITGWLGFMLGPILNHYVKMEHGYGIIINSFLGTALTFAGTSFYAYKNKPTIKGVWMSNLFWISLVAMGLSLVNYYFFHMTIISILISVVFLAISVLYLTFEMSRIFKNEPGINYVLATVGIFVSLYNIFVSLLNILGFVNSRD
jgi:modulator of FtsH protease